MGIGLSGFIAAFLILLSFALALRGDEEKSGKEFLAQSRALSDIRAPGAPGFRLQAAFSFIDRDLNTVQGTYTETWVSDSRWRKETIIGTLRRIEVGGSGIHWLLENSPDFPEAAERVPALLHPLPSENAYPELDSYAHRTRPTGATQCFMSRLGSLPLRTVFCFDLETGALVEKGVPEELPTQTATYSCQYAGFRRFGAYWFPREVACAVNGHRKLQAKVTALEILRCAQNDSGAHNDNGSAQSGSCCTRNDRCVPEQNLFTPPAGAIELRACASVPALPEAIHAPEPPFPGGTEAQIALVRLWMVIDEQGLPQHLKLEHSGGKRFDEAALKAVRGWRFKPGTCDGKPAAMAYTLDVRFHQR